MSFSRGMVDRVMEYLPIGYGIIYHSLETGQGEVCFSTYYLEIVNLEFSSRVLVTEI